MERFPLLIVLVSGVVAGGLLVRAAAPPAVSRPVAPAVGGADSGLPPALERIAAGAVPALRGTDLRDHDLQGADFRGLLLERVDLRGSDLRGADLRGACIWECD